MKIEKITFFFLTFKISPLIKYYFTFKYTSLEFKVKFYISVISLCLYTIINKTTELFNHINNYIKVKQNINSTTLKTLNVNKVVETNWLRVKCS
jgi:hypothetical protein